MKKDFHHKKNIPINDNNIIHQSVKPGTKAMIKLEVGRLPSGTNMQMNAHVYNAKEDGPSVLIIAGVHGDEINGVETLRQLLYDGIFDNIKVGKIIVIPIVNVFGFVTFSRYSPDGKDVNRSFPGNSRGSLASRIANVITKKILPHIDYVIDLHTGSASRYNYPQIRCTENDQKSIELAKIFGAPFLIQKPLISKSLRKIAFERSIPIVVYEGGESLRFDGKSISIAIQGIYRVLNSLQMLEEVTKELNDQYLLTKSSWIRASQAGLFLWVKQSGTYVKKNEVLGHINDPQGNKSVAVVSPREGYIIGHNNASVVTQGDALFHISFGYEAI